MGGALTCVPLDYHSHVHRRALAVAQFPGRPVLCRGEEETAERGAALLAQASMGITPAQDEESDALVLPEDTRGRVVREQGG